MNNYYNFENFKDYLLDKQSNIRCKQDTLWVNQIPLPLTMLSEIFSSGESLFTLYGETLLSAYILADYDLGQKASDDHIFNQLPNPTFVASNSDLLLKIFDKITLQESFKLFETALFAALGTSTKKLSQKSFMNALNHRGKKYNRLYYPDSISLYFDTHFPAVKKVIAKQKSDMFGNVLADAFRIYRNGFSDGFSPIFNRFLDFKIDMHNGVSPTIATFGDIYIDESDRDALNVVWGKTSNGELWEPRLDNNGDVVTVVNRDHSVFDPDKDEAENDLFYKLIQAMSYFEMTISNETDLRQLESLREQVSRDLRRL